MGTLALGDWKKLIKSHADAPETAPVTRALEEYGRVEGKADPEPVVAALEKVIERASAAMKKNAKVKDLADYLDDMVSDARKALSKAEKLAASQGDGEEEDAELGDALRVALARVKKLDSQNARPFVLALGQLPGLVIPKRAPVSREHRNNARAMRTGKGKLLAGKCYGEGGKYIFEFEDKPPGGLTKLIKKAAKEHARVEISLKVRGGGEEIDDEADLAELTDFGSETANVPTPGGPTRAPDEGGDAGRAKKALADAKARLDALKGTDPARAAGLSGLLVQAVSLTSEKKYPEAQARLDEFERRAGETVTPPRVQPAPAGGAPEKAVSIVVLQQSRLVWDKARKAAHAELDALKRAILDAARDDPDLAEIADSVAMFDDVKDRFDEALTDKLDEALNAASPAQRAERNREAAAIIRAHQAALARDNVIKNLDGNPFLSVNVEKTLAGTLNLLASKLGG